MHSLFFVLIWPLAAICPFLPRRHLVVGVIVFLACQMLLWWTMMGAMNSPDWDGSAGDALIPAVILMPTWIFSALIVFRLIGIAISQFLQKSVPPDE